MKDDFDNKMKKLFKKEIHKPSSFDYNIKNFSYKSSRKKIIMQFATATVGLLLCTGVVFATTTIIKNEKNKDNSRGLGKGVDTAIENGYIENTNMDYIEQTASVMNEEEIVNDVSVQAKVNNFLMDDRNISLEFEFVFGENIDEYVDLNNIHVIDFKDLKITDDENRYLNEGSGWQAFPSGVIKEHHLVNLMYDVFGEDFPKSRELHLSFNKIVITEEAPTIEERKETVLTGEWKIDLEVPEKMYNRTDDYYKVISCDNENFEIYTTKATDTGFEIGLYVNNLEVPKYPMEIYDMEAEIMNNPDLTMEEKNEAINNIEFSSPYRDMLNEYHKKYKVIDTHGNGALYIPDISETKPDGYGGRTWSTNDIEEGPECYVENENGEQFIASMSPSRKQDGNFRGEKYSYYETFEMTKTDATDKVKVVLYCYGEPVTIQLEKIK